MNWFSLVAIYFVVWWLVLFAVLPFGVRTQAEEGDTVLGSTASAPVRPMLGRKAIATSIISAIVVAGFWFIYVRLGITIDALAHLYGPQPVNRP
jgi:predicted secreted protein